MTVAEAIEQEGYNKGLEANKRKMVLRMIDQGVDIRTILTVAEMTPEELAELRGEKDPDRP